MSSEAQIASDYQLAKQLSGARPPEYQGTLKKKGVTPGWSERYFRLYGNKLVYYKNDQFVGDINLTNSSGRLLEEGKFAISGPFMKREFKLDATTRANRQRWLSKLSTCGVDIPGFRREAAEKKPVAREQWSCSMCTLVNAATNNRCDVCGSHYTSRVQTNVLSGQDALMRQIQENKQAAVPPPYQQAAYPPQQAHPPQQVEPQYQQPAAYSPPPQQPPQQQPVPVQEPAAPTPVYVPQSEVQMQQPVAAQPTIDASDIPMAC
eukprot:TRINITY_DN1126_c0_g1_i1.p1 TRINITY_DN1126_c0_g1~~TRINITY_DN1126_c0_g1_i1.p1  ORF type:complete len:295 (+),score=68.57 TRINITY_DN1126_c0_g1_i1:97-885(+)